MRAVSDDASGSEAREVREHVRWRSSRTPDRSSGNSGLQQGERRQLRPSEAREEQRDR